MHTRERLEAEVLKHKHSNAVDENNLDPIMVAHRYKDPTISLICALFSYGNVKQIVKFLNSLDFSLLNENDEKIREALSKHYYRFQKSEDVIELFITLKRLNKESSLETVFKVAYNEKRSVIDGVNACISKLRELSSHSSKGYSFLVGKVTEKTKGAGALKRWMMFLRWMVREDNIDMGLWHGISKADLIMPLDTHTYKIGLSWGLLKRKTYDLEAAIELTNSLKKFDKEDPLKYDFAIYRLGQGRVV
ncbi:TIGR02757 family protein [uncultured Sulfurimonas sp.]|uniref:TIGR02757 family protein n=1 Tax=uncultured Sulfurimonas sp. TaxID=291845 RepID=UPI0032B10B9B